jgi:DNA replication protein DnaC
MPAANQSARDVATQIASLTRTLKAPTLRASVDWLVERATAESCSYSEFLAVCVQREVSARESHGGEGRIRAARFPARKSLEEFDYDPARGLKRETIAHLGTLDFVSRTLRPIGHRVLSRPTPSSHRAGLTNRKQEGVNIQPASGGSDFGRR